MKDLDRLNAALDQRHLSKRVISTKQDDKGVDIASCEQCRRIITSPEIQVYGMCPRCNGRRFRGTGSYGIQDLRLTVLNLLHHWVIWGEKGWGWKRAIRKREKQLGLDEARRAIAEEV